ncbi:auxin efflux carrier [Basidiobolus meristosporus CBS 931.73]|uniref:Auxin efflux carrier n=1 Tax=Basidiobolus meristosporus CBS 931.73 TaxID=1314790 RepID=A0A1Y1Z291_9FUNG|nr:auxin efflux carrier [Basidiobolus meristosporus CBS 931.73]|eukprot:ORY04224.1 auxin efflux carrier [Basidiobolus meristosporus CBS 931.73]
MDVASLIKASGEAILQIAVTCGTGIYLAKNGILSRDLQKSLSNLNLNFLTPCLLFTTVAFAVSPSVFLTFWPIPSYSLIFTLISMLASTICARLFHFSKAQANFSKAASMFPNTNSLPIPLIQSLANSTAAKMLLWDDNDTPENVQARGISYIVIFAILGNFLRFSYGFQLLDTPITQTNDDHLPEHDKSIDSDYASSTGDEGASEYAGLLGQPSTHSTPNLFQVLVSKIKQSYKIVRKVFNPPLYATFAGLFVGLIPRLKGLLFGSNPIFRPIMRAIDICGQASIPLILLCLGAQLYALSGRSGFKKVIWTIVVQRLLVMPMVAIGVVLLTHKLISLGSDPVFVLTMMILGSGPTAVNLMNICQALGNYEDEMAELLLYSYLIAAPALTLWVVVYLWVIGQTF